MSLGVKVLAQVKLVIGVGDLDDFAEVARLETRLKAEIRRRATATAAVVVISHAIRGFAAGCRCVGTED